MAVITTRVQSLKRRAAALSAEIDGWLARADQDAQFAKNASQLEAIDTFMACFLKRLEAEQAQLECLAQAQAADSQVVLTQALKVALATAGADQVWDYFRAKLTQRYSPDWSVVLLAADLVAHSCYKCVVEQADELGLKARPAVRGYPLTFLTSGYSPLTWPRSTAIGQLDYRLLPIPMVGVPWDQVTNPWELLSLHHEVAHDLDRDLGDPSAEMGARVASALRRQGVPADRTEMWQRWSTEMWADFLGILLAGPAFVPFLAAFLSGRPQDVCTLVASSVHPTPYIRILLGAAFVRAALPMEAGGYVAAVVDEWQALYGRHASGLGALVGNVDVLADTFLHTPLDSLIDRQGNRHVLGELAAFSADDFRQQQQAAELFRAGGLSGLKAPLRHLVGAAFMAAEPGAATPVDLEHLSAELKQAIVGLAPPGQLPLRPTGWKEHMDLLANALFDELAN